MAEKKLNPSGDGQKSNPIKSDLKIPSKTKLESGGKNTNKKLKNKVEKLKIKVAKKEKPVSSKTQKKAETVEKEVKIQKVSLKQSAVAKGKSLKVGVYNKAGEVIEKVDLPKEIFAAKVNPVLMAQAVRVFLANQRAGSASVKTRGEVRGSTRKIYRQKGTGKARHGAITAPIFVGGGIVFGPSPRDFSLNFPKQMKRKALFSALTLKLENNQISVLSVDNIKPKTKEFFKIIKNLNLVDKKKTNKILFVIPEKLENIEKAARNIEGIEIEKANLLNTYEVLKSTHILFLKESISTLTNTFLKS